MKNCPSCGAAADEAARYCLECGHAFEAAAEPGDPWHGREIASRYRLVRKLGEGGMGEVYVAEQLAMDRLVALKLLREGLADDPSTVERFKREARAASRLSHPNTIILHDFGVDHDGTFYLAMELLEGETLADVLRREKRLRPERAMAMLLQVCGSLEEAHAQGVVHRDLKPENIFLTRRGGHPDFVKVLDFGIAKVRARAAEAPVETITRAGMIFGTPQYMSPEQIRGDELDARSDVYALGVMLYQMISGHLPFQAGTPVEMLTKHLHATPQPIGDVDAAHRAAVARLEAVALRALSKDPDHRPSSAREFQEDLMAAVPQFSTAPMTGPVFATPVASAPVGAIEVPSRGRGVGLAVAAFLLAAGAGTTFWFANAPRDPGDGGAALPALLPEQGEGAGAPASEAAAPASEAAAPASAAAAPASEAAAPASEAAAEAPTAEEKAAEEEAKKVEAEVAPADPKAAEELAKKLEAEKAAAEAEKKAAEADAKVKEAEEAKKAAEFAKAEADAAKAVAVAAKAESAADKAAAEKAAGDAQKAQAEVERLKAELDRAAAEKAAAEAKIAEFETKAEEAKAKAEAVRKKKKIASVAFGRVFVNATKGARVYVDGKLRGTAPIAGLRLKPGRHSIEVRSKDSKKKKAQSVTVSPNGVHRVRISL